MRTERRKSPFVEDSLSATPAGRAIARPSRILLAAAGLYLLALLSMPAGVDRDSAFDGVFFDPAPAIAAAAGASGSLLVALGGAELRVERPWIEAPLELNGAAELPFELYERDRRELLLRAQSGAPQPTTLTVRANQVTLGAVSLQQVQRFYRWQLPAAALRLGTNRFSVELRDPAGRPAAGLITWARVSGGTLPPSIRSARIAHASLGEIELPAVVQVPGTGLVLERPTSAGAQVLQFSIGTYSRGTSGPAEWTFQVALLDPEGRSAALFSRRLETGRRPIWYPVRIPLGQASGQPLRLLFVVEGRAAPEQYALWGDPHLVYQGGG